MKSILISRLKCGTEVNSSLTLSLWNCQWLLRLLFLRVAAVDLCSTVDKILADEHLIFLGVEPQQSFFFFFFLHGVNLYL